MKIRLVMIIALVLMMIPTCMASPSEELNEMIEISSSIDNWRTYEEFNGNIQLHVGEELYYMTVENKSIELYEGETDTFEYDIYTNENDLESVKKLLQKYSDNGKLGMFDSLKAFYLLEKTPIFNENSDEIKISNKIGMSTTWLA